MFTYEQQTKKLLSKLLELTAHGTAEIDTDTAQDSDEMDGQTSFFDKKRNPYED